MASGPAVCAAKSATCSSCRTLRSSSRSRAPVSRSGHVGCRWTARRRGRRSARANRARPVHRASYTTPARLRQSLVCPMDRLEGAPEEGGSFVVEADACATAGQRVPCPSCPRFTPLFDPHGLVSATKLSIAHIVRGAVEGRPIARRSPVQRRARRLPCGRRRSHRPRHRRGAGCLSRWS